MYLPRRCRRRGVETSHSKSRSLVRLLSLLLLPGTAPSLLRISRCNDTVGG